MLNQEETCLKKWRIISTKFQRILIYLLKSSGMVFAVNSIRTTNKLGQQKGYADTETGFPAQVENTDLDTHHEFL
jgi:hypothetical protein